MEKIENKKIKETAYIETFENGMKLIVVPKKETNSEIYDNMIHEKYIPRREEIIMKKVLLHCAMEKEGKQIADKLELKKKDEKTYQKDNITLIVTGIGKQLTAIEITKYIEENL